MVASIARLQSATLAARQASGVKVATRSSRGLLQLGYSVEEGRKVHWVELSDWLTVDAAVEALGQFKAVQ